MTRPDPSASRCFALLPCAGVGTRAGTAQPKQYRPLAGRLLVEHTLRAFAAVARIARTVVVVAPGDRVLASGAGRDVVHCGGRSRAESVLNGLVHLIAAGAGERDWVLVHDAARCLITPALIDRLIDACLGDAVGGLLALPLRDTLKRAQAGRIAATLERGDKWLAQTPQMFRLGALHGALAAQAPGGLAGITDEAGAMEALGLHPLLVAGDPQNIKVTYPEDFVLAEAILRSRAA